MSKDAVLQLIKEEDAAYVDIRFTDPRGKIMLVAAGGLMTSGIAVMAKMVRFEI